MLIACLIVVGIVALVNAAIVWRADRRINDKLDSWAEGFSGFFSQNSPDSPSDFNKVLDQVAVLFADRYRIALSASDRGQIGAASRDVNRGLEQVAEEVNPAYALANSLPKSLKKNPVALAGLNVLIQRILAGSGSTASPGSIGVGSNGSRQIKFDL